MVQATGKTSAQKVAKKKRKRGSVPFNEIKRFRVTERNLFFKDDRGFSKVKELMEEPPKGFKKTFECVQKPQIRIMGNLNFVNDATKKVVKALNLGKIGNLKGDELVVWKNQKSHYEEVEKAVLPTGKEVNVRKRSGNFCKNVLRSYINPEGRL